MTIVCSAMDSPFGRLWFAERAGKLLRLYFADAAGEHGFERVVRQRDAEHGEPVVWDHAAPSPARTQLQEYCDGRRTGFDLELVPRGTPFQREVWRALQQIPFGETRSYRDLALAIGRPAAVRAVGAANGQNPICIVLPCHRVIGADGSLTGYAFGLDAKRRLLEFEGVLAV
jgi:methylated-DNA-[protein]-cysteine S-methyltransferase